MPRYRWIIFDADGTLLDYDRAEASALEGTFAAHGLPFDDRVHRTFVEVNGRLWEDLEQGRVTSGRLRVQRFEELFSHLGVEVDAAEFSRAYLTELGRQHGIPTPANFAITAALMPHENGGG